MKGCVFRLRVLHKQRCENPENEKQQILLVKLERGNVLGCFFFLARKKTTYMMNCFSSN